MTSDERNRREDRLFSEARAAFPDTSVEQALVKFLDTPTGKALHRDMRRVEALAREGVRDAMDPGILYEAERSGLPLEDFLNTATGRRLSRARANLQGRSRAKPR